MYKLTCHCINKSHFIYSLTGWRTVSSFHFWTIMNNAARDTYVQVFWSICSCDNIWTFALYLKDCNWNLCFSDHLLGNGLFSLIYAYNLSLSGKNNYLICLFIWASYKKGTWKRKQFFSFLHRQINKAIQIKQYSSI